MIKIPCLRIGSSGAVRVNPVSTGIKGRNQIDIEGCEFVCYIYYSLLFYENAWHPIDGLRIFPGGHDYLDDFCNFKYAYSVEGLNFCGAIPSRVHALKYLQMTFLFIKCFLAFFWTCLQSSKKHYKQLLCGHLQRETHLYSSSSSNRVSTWDTPTRGHLAGGEMQCVHSYLVL